AARPAGSRPSRRRARGARRGRVGALTPRSSGPPRAPAAGASRAHRPRSRAARGAAGARAPALVRERRGVGDVPRPRLHPDLRSSDRAAGRAARVRRGRGPLRAIDRGGSRPRLHRRGPRALGSWPRRSPFSPRRRGGPVECQGRRQAGRLRLSSLSAQAGAGLRAGNPPAPVGVLRRVPGPERCRHRGATARLRRRPGQVDGAHRRRGAPAARRQHASSRPPARSRPGAARSLAPRRMGAPPPLRWL
ncbi:MAG: hypothetical protein AVDCRST_MAG45-787, partial [uncultured Solirubrobacterales bacterium]